MSDNDTQGQVAAPEATETGDTGTSETPNQVLEHLLRKLYRNGDGPNLGRVEKLLRMTPSQRKEYILNPKSSENGAQKLDSYKHFFTPLMEHLELAGGECEDVSFPKIGAIPTRDVVKETRYSCYLPYQGSSCRRTGFYFPPAEVLLKGEVEPIGVGLQNLFDKADRAQAVCCDLHADELAKIRRKVFSAYIIMQQLTEFQLLFMIPLIRQVFEIWTKAEEAKREANRPKPVDPKHALLSFGAELFGDAPPEDQPREEQQSGRSDGSGRKGRPSW